MIYLFGGLGIVILILGLAVGFEHERVVAADNRVAAITLELKTAQERAKSQELQWSAEVDKAEAQTRKTKEDADAEISTLKQRIAKLPGRIVVFDTATASLFTDIANAANATQPPPVDKPAADPVPPPATAEALYDEGEVTMWLADAAKAYRDARGKWQACVDYYGNLQKGQP